VPSLQVCAQATHLCIDPSDVDANRVRHRISRAREACCCEIARRLVHGRHKLVSLLLQNHIDSTVAFHSPIKHGLNVLDIARALAALAPRCSLKGVPVTQPPRQRSTTRTQGDVRRSGPNNACALHKLLDAHDMPTSSVDANLQIRELRITAPWDTRRHIPNHVDAAWAVAAGRTTRHGRIADTGHVHTCRETPQHAHHTT
jgi:hypothetical protein